MKFISTLLFIGLVLMSCTAQKIDTQSISEKTLESKELSTKLIVGITVDQMRQEYIYRYWDKYGTDGFKRLVSDGYSFENAHYSYKPTYTAPGHASIYTGTTPATHGIIGNNWYDKTIKTTIYCAGDTSVHSVGSDSKAGQMSPKNMLTTTVTDELRLATNFKGKSIGISIKDRGAILPAGHAANGAYWFDSSIGDWITSTYYMESLPTWVTDFNSQKTTDAYLSQDWNTLLPIESYTESIVDNNPFEMIYKGEESPVFPHKLKEIAELEGYGLLAKTPFGNSATKDLAKAAIAGEELGMDEITDFLAVSFSSTDYIGHQFGARSIETEDTYLRLDRDIADLLDYLDQAVGEGEYVVFLTADHGAAETPLYLENMNIPAGYFNIEGYKDGLNTYLDFKLGKKPWVENVSNDQVFLNHLLIQNAEVALAEVTEAIVYFSLQFEGIAAAVSSEELRSAYYGYNSSMHLIQRGYNQRRSGDVHLLLDPAWMTYFRQGTTHGTSYNYDTHVPIVFYGGPINKGLSYKPVNVIDIAPTISAMLHIPAPNGSNGQVLAEVFD